MIRLAILLSVCLTILPTAGTQADVLIHLKDGRTIRVPVAVDDVTGIEFETTGAKTTARPEAKIEAKAKAKTAPPEPMSRENPMGARVLKVGPGTFYAAPSAAAKVARDGDIVEIAAGTYRGDVAVWTANNLTIRGVGGKVQLLAAGRSAQSKAIWVLRGNNYHIENISFSGARVPDRNGAGIRLEGAGLVIDNCDFHDNQMGILAGTNQASDVVIRNSRFIHNVVEGTQSLGHNIYVGQVNSLTVTDSLVEGAVRGHNVKSRARVTILIGNKIIDGDRGASSYLVDLSDGGIGILRDNYLEQGPRAENYTLVSYGAENLVHKENRLLVVNNEFVNQAPNGTFIRNYTDAPAEITGNRFEGSGTILSGPGVVTAPVDGSSPVAAHHLPHDQGGE